MNKQLQETIRTWLWLMVLLVAPGAAWAQQIVISQVYGGAGCGTAGCSTYKNDYIELFNRGTTAVSVNGWSVQYSAATGTAWQVTSLPNVSIPAGGYLLIAEGAGANGVSNIPTADAAGTIAMSATAAKVALVSVTSALSGSCPTGANIVDFVGYGATPNCNEGGSNAPAPSTTTAILRAANGCTDINVNSTDFTAGSPNPRNSSTVISPCGGTTPVASLSANPVTLTSFVATQGTVSNVQTYTLTGSNPDTNPVSVSATANIELSTDNITFGPNLSLPTTASAVSQVVYARLTNTAPTGAFSGTITNTASGTLAASVTVSGQVNAPNAPTLSASQTALSGFTTTQGTASAEQTYTLTATNLTDAISVSAPAGVEVSQTSGSGFTSSLTLPNTTTFVTVYVRLTGNTAGLVSGTITNTSGSLTASVPISGTVSSNTPYTPIALARAGINSTFTIAGRVTVSNQLGSRQIYIQDATGGIAVYSGPSGPDFTTLVNIGDSVQVRGPVTVFNGYLELTGTGNFTVVSGAGSRVPTPVAITPDQLSSYQGQLVSIIDASISGSGNFAGSTSYTITAAGQSATLRINANSPLAGAGRPANPVSVTGIADRFVSGATTTGTNGLQLQPRILADIPGSTPPQDLTCTIAGNSTLTPDQTLDIAAWNFEFFGADAGTISCPSGTTLTYNNFGPTNEALQQTNATTVLTKLNADIISAEEVSDINRFDAAVKSIPGSYSYVCSDRFSYYFQNECDQVPTGNPPTVFGPTRLAQKVCVIYNTATVTPVLAETKPLLDGLYSYPSSSGWSSGRLPFLFVADATINGVTKRLHVVAIHAKSGSATADYNRRKQDIIDLKANLDANYPNANIILLGDYNDKLNGSIAVGQQSSYQPFVTDVTNYSAITLPLENQGCSTFNSSASFIDHMIVSNELQKAYVSNSVYVLQPFSIPNYGNTTSDHNPIEARFDLSQLVSPATALTLVASANPTTLLTTGTTTLSATVTGGTAPYSYTFSGPGTITPSGNTATVSSLTAGVQTFTVLVADATTTPASQTISATVSVTVTAAPTPTITFTPTVLPSIVNTTQLPGSNPVSYTVSATGLTTSDFQVTVPSPFQISASGSTGNTLTLTLNNDGTLSPTEVTVGLVSSTPGSFSGLITHISGSTTATLPVSGTTSSPILEVSSTALNSFTTTVGTPSAVQTYTITTLNQLGGVVEAPNGVEIRTGSNSFSSSLAIPTSLSAISIPVDVRLTGAVAGPVSGSIAQHLINQANQAIINVAVSGTVLSANTPPTATGIANQTATVGQSFSLNVATAFSDTETPTSLTFSAAGLPDGLLLTGSTISGTPSTTGVSTVTVTATDPGNLSVNASFSLTVSPASTTVTVPFAITKVTTVSCTTITAGERAVTFNPEYTGLNGQPVTFQVVNETLPLTNAGPYSLRLYTDNPVITLKATQAGTVGETSFSYNWLAACAGNTPNNVAPTVVNSIPSQTATAGQFFSYSIPTNTFADANGDALTLSVSGLPQNLSFAGNTISGVPSTTGVVTVTVTATDPGKLSVSTSFDLTVLPSSTTVTAPFAITGVTLVSCTPITASQRVISFTPQYAGLTGGPITFQVVNELAPTSSPAPYSLNLYTDNPVITLKATQAGTVGETSFSYNWLAACNGVTPGNTAPTVANAIPNQTATADQSFTLNLATTFTDANGDALTLSASGLPQGLTLSGTTISGTPSLTGVSTVSVTATDPGNLSVTTSFILTVNPVSTTTTTGFAITAVTTVSCQTLSVGERLVSFTPQYAGLSGQPITFSVVNESVPTTDAGPYSLKLYTDNPVITLKATQAGSAEQASFSYNWLAACNSTPNARMGAKTEVPLNVLILGNPVRNAVEVEVTGAEGTSLNLLLTDAQGRTLNQHHIEQATASERIRFTLGNHTTGILLLRAVTPTQSQTVRMLKAE